MNHNNVNNSEGKVSNTNHTCACHQDVNFNHNNTHAHNHYDGEYSRWVPSICSFCMLLLGMIASHIEILPNSKFLIVFWYFIAYCIVAFPVLKNTVKEFLKGDIFNEFSLMTLATVGAFIIGEYPEAVGVMLFYTIGENLQDIAISKAQKSIKSLLDIRPNISLVKRESVFVEMKPEEVAIGDTIMIKVGDKVPLDGVLLSEKSIFNTSALTGESVPRVVRKGEPILAGMINQESVVEVEVKAKYSDSSLAKILYLTQKALARKAKTELFIRRFAKIYTPIVFLLSLGITFLPAFFVGDYIFVDWLYRGLVFLVISCPCALVVSVPLGYFSGIGVASKNGILFKGANYLERLTKLSHVGFDKTGTVTNGTFAVQHISSIEMSDRELLSLVARIERRSTHPIAKAIVEYAQEELRQNVDSSSVDVKEKAGYGLIAKIDDKKVLVGNNKLLQVENVSYPKDIDDIVETKVLVAIDGRFAGYIIIADSIREEAAELINMLSAMGVSTVMFSGDNDAIVQKVAKNIGIDMAYGNLLPEHKVRAVEELKVDKSVVLGYVGDGINDSPALAVSDVGIAIGCGGSQAAIDISDVVIQNNDIRNIGKAIKIGKYTQKIVVQNIVFALSVKTTIMILGAFDIASMWLAVFADVGVALLAILNSVRLLYKKI